MSHFAVLVVGNEIEKQLAPFQENNMGDCPKKFLQFHDSEAEYLPRYQSESVTQVKSPEGKLFWPHDRRFQVQIGGNPFNTEQVYPEGYIEVEVPFNELFSSFEAFMSDYAGCERDEETGRFGYWENPNAKWDWYVIGGRWTGFFKLKTRPVIGNGKICFDAFGFSDAEFMNMVSLFQQNPEKFKKVVSKYGHNKAEAITKAVAEFIQRTTPEHKVGEPGTLTNKAKKGYADQVRKRDIDFDFMRDTAGQEAGEVWDQVNTAIAGKTDGFMSWDQMREKHGENIDAARNEYGEQPAVKAFRALDEIGGFFEKVENYLLPREEYVTRARNSAITTFAVVKDGKWYQKGEMGWFACVSNEMDENEWSAQFAKLLDELPDDALLTVVDCHI